MRLATINMVDAHYANLLPSQEGGVTQGVLDTLNGQIIEADNPLPP